MKIQDTRLHWNFRYTGNRYFLSINMSPYSPGHTYTKKLFIGYLKFHCDWVSPILCKGPTCALPLEILILLVWG